MDPIHLDRARMTKTPPSTQVDDELDTLGALKWGWGGGGQLFYTDS